MDLKLLQHVDCSSLLCAGAPVKTVLLHYFVPVHRLKSTPPLLCAGSPVKTVLVHYFVPVHLSKQYSPPNFDFSSSKSSPVLSSARLLLSSYFKQHLKERNKTFKFKLLFG